MAVAYVAVREAVVALDNLSVTIWVVKLQNFAHRQYKFM